MGTGRKFVAALVALAFAGAIQASERPLIQFAEKVSLSTGTAQTQFDAYGRRFVLDLQSNDRALSLLKLNQPASVAGYKFWRGRIAGQSGSWVRLTEHAGVTEGVIWDGSDLYAVTRYEKVAAYLGSPLQAKAGDTVVFRLSDSINLLPSGYCGTGAPTDGLAPNNSLVQYRNMIAELQTQALAGATKQIEISMIADSAMQARIADPIGAMLVSYNIVDGIYAEQLGLLIVPTDMRSIPAVGDPFTATDPSALLGQLATYRQNTPAVGSLGIAHLFTGHELDGDTIGIARVSGACSVTDAVSLTEGWNGALISALVMAHEIGHNLGAEHDGAGACAGTPETYIMAPTLNGSQQFSQCSLTAISAFIATAPASCITPAVFAHVELPQEALVVTGELDVPLVVPVDLYSVGTLAINNVKLELPIPPSLVLTATTSGVTCAPVAAALSCDVGTIAAGGTKRVELTFLPGMQGGFPTVATVSASNNQNTRNSSQDVSINVLPNVDTTVAVVTSKSTATFGDDVDVTLTVTSLKSHTARDVGVGVYGGGLRGMSVDAPAGVTCQFDVNFPGQTACVLGDIPGGQTRTIVVHSKAWQVGTSLYGTAYVHASNDPDSSNNNTSFTMSSINAAQDVGLEDLTTSDPVQYNMPFEYKGNLHSYGSQSASGVRVDVDISMQESAALNSITSVTVGGNACTQLASWHYDCVIGTMAAGEVLPVSIKGIATGLGETRVTLNSYAAVNDNPSNDQVHRGWVVRYGLDASVSIGMSQLILVEGKEDSGLVAVWSNGTQPTTNAVMNVEVPPQVHFTRFFARDATTTSCSIVDPQHLRCTYNIPPASSYQSVDYLVVGDVPGAYQASATVTLVGDENPGNDSVQWPITVNPALDVGVRTAFVFPQYLVAGHDWEVPITVFTGSRPVSGASLTVFAQVNAEVAAVSGAASCTRVDAHQYTCALGNLAGGSSVTLNATLSAAPTLGTGVFAARVDLPGDNIPNNNQISAVFNVAPVGDARVAVANTETTATAGIAFDLPSITVWRQGEVVGGKLIVTLPAGVGISSMSGSVFACSGTTMVECDLPSSWPESQGIQVDLKLLAPTASNFVVTARVSAINDFASANDEASIGVTMIFAPTPPPNPPPSNPPPSNPPSSGGGGGRIEWPVALVLGLLLIRRQRRKLT